MVKTKEHTKKLHQMNDLCIEKKKLDSRLNTLQNQQVYYFSSDPLSEFSKLLTVAIHRNVMSQHLSNLDHFWTTSLTLGQC